MKFNLNALGFDIKSDYEDYDSFDEYKLPFGSTIGEKGNAYTEFQRSMLDGINYIRKSSVSVDKEQFERMMPVYEKDSIYEFLANCLDRCRLINKGSIKKVSEGYIGMSQTDYNYKADTAYGFSDVIFYFIYNTARHRFEVRFNATSLNYHIQEQNRIRQEGNENLWWYGSSYEDGMKAFEWFKEKNLFEKFEFIPIYIELFDGVVISHKKYKTEYGMSIDAVTSPTCGCNIKKHPEIMERLSDWMNQGGIIVDKNLYLILEDRTDRSKCYLKRYREEENIIH